MRTLILGANGRVARIATELLLRRSDVEMSLFLRKAVRLESLESDRVSVIGGDVLDAELLEQAMVDCDVVYANLRGPLGRQARCIVQAMTTYGVKRLIFMSPTESGDQTPDTDTASRSPLHAEDHGTAVIEASSLDYTILRPRLCGMHALFDTASQMSTAELVVRLITTPGLHIRRTLEVDYAPLVPTAERRDGRRRPHSPQSRLQAFKDPATLCRDRRVAPSAPKTSPSRRVA